MLAEVLNNIWPRNRSQDDDFPYITPGDLSVHQFFISFKEYYIMLNILFFLTVSILLCTVYITFTFFCGWTSI